MTDRAICIDCGEVCSGCLTGNNHTPCPACNCITVPLKFLCEYCSGAEVEEPGLFCMECKTETGRDSYQYSTKRGWYV